MTPVVASGAKYSALFYFSVRWFARPFIRDMTFFCKYLELATNFLGSSFQNRRVWPSIRDSGVGPADIARSPLVSHLRACFADLGWLVSIDNFHPASDKGSLVIVK